MGKGRGPNGKGGGQPLARRSRTDPHPGPWYLSYAKVDHGGKFGWPALGSATDSDLTQVLRTLNVVRLGELTQVARDTGMAAHKVIDVDSDPGISSDASGRLDHLIDQDPDHFGNPLFEFTYCYRRGDPRRIWAVYIDRVIYPLWWDPEHKVSGGQWDGAADTGPCPAECPHPDGPNGRRP